MVAVLLLNSLTHAMNPVVDVVVRALSRALVPMFLVGMAGSSFVVVITVVSDVMDFFNHDGENDMPTADNMKAS